MYKRQLFQGAADGGIDIPHSEKRFPGYDAEEKMLAADVHRQHIFGQHVADYMNHLKSDDEDAYKKQFSQYIKNGINAEKIEGMYKSCHSAIRKNPDRQSKDKKSKVDKKRWTAKKLTYAQRREKVAKAKKEFLGQIEAQRD